MNTRNIIILAVGVVVLGALAFLLLQSPKEPADTRDTVFEYKDLVRLQEPKENVELSSPFTMKGEARGPWYFEASFPIRLLDANGNEIALEPGFVMTTQEWMTTDFMPFEAQIAFAASATSQGTLIIEKSNPSGLPEQADSFSIPVWFAEPSAATSVQLYYYNEDEDKDEEGNIQCSREGLVAVEREIPVTQTPIQDTIRLLLQGNLTQAERDQGISTEYPLTGVSLKGASLNNGVLMLEFEDLVNRTSGGACRTGILWFQIEATAQQFPEIQDVQFIPEELFQP